ncbi:MAG: type II toxin-antitoxin system RelE/ParE family toxin [bacterium]|nr:type II toxin-antitoxin system RelE/ParE family toxin [bacterium]
MKYILQTTDRARKDLASLDFPIQKMIAKKIDFYLSVPNPLEFAEPLKVPFLGNYRFRVGEYRIMFKVEPSGVITILLILNIKHRKDSYR